MIEYIKRLLCTHGNMETITDGEWVGHGGMYKPTYEQRKYLICKKCGYKRKVSKR